MKRLFLLSTPLMLLVACNTSATKSETASDTTSNRDTAAAVTYAYPVDYFSEYDKGDPSYAQTVLNLWKDYDHNTLEDHLDVFADTIRIEFRDGSIFQGTRDSLLAMMKKYRTPIDSVYSTVAVVETVKPKGKDVTWVSVWGTEYDIKKGKKDSVNLNENWMYDKNGKIAFMTQYAQKPPTGR